MAVRFGVSSTGIRTVLAASGIPFIKASSGTMGNNGAITAMTTTLVTYNAPGAYLWLPAGAIAAGSLAGWYWFVGSSGTAGTCYNSTYSSGQPVVGVTTAFSTTGPGAFTGDTGTVNGPTITIPANPGLNSVIVVDAYYGELTSNANNKLQKVIYSTSGGTTVSSVTSTTFLNIDLVTEIAAKGVTGNQVTNAWGTTQGSNLGAFSAPIETTVDQTAASSVVIAMQNATATDNQVLKRFSVELIH